MKPARFGWPLHLLLALGFGAYYLGHTVALNTADPRLLAHFAAHKPYQLRVLMPVLLALGEWGGLDIVRVCQVLMLGSALAFAVVFRLFLREFVGDAAALLALLIWPLLFLFYSHHWFYLYDLPSLVFLTLGLWLLKRQKWTIFGFTLLFATLNRESSVLLIIAFAAIYFVPGDRAFWRRLALFSAIWLGVKLGLSLLFAGNAGPNLEVHLSDNLAFINHAASWNWGFKLSLMVFGALLLGALFSWRDSPRILRVSSLLSLVLIAVLMIVGVVSETRLLGEMVPLLLPSLCVGVTQKWPDLALGETLGSPI